MAKNLKINIKNTQLAEALKFTREQKPSVKKKKEEPLAESAASKETVSSPSLPPPAPEQVPKEVSMQSPPTVKKEASPIPEATAPKPEYRHKPQPFRPNFPPPRSSFRQDTRPASAPASSRPPYPSKTTGYSSGIKRPPISKEVSGSKVSDLPKKESFKPTPRELEDKNQRSKAPYEIRPVKKIPQKTFDSRDRKGLRDDLDDQGWRRRKPHKMRSHKKEEVVIRPKELKIHIPITIKDLASEMKLKASQLVSKLFMKGIMLTLNDYLDDETTIQLLGHDFDCEITIDTSEEDRLRITDKTIKQEIEGTKPYNLITRPPVVAFMGHVDHGKTSLIDAIRKSNIASLEAGDITQHIGAFKCHTEAGDLTILDTPGHEAFSSMRTRGADVTDIVVLVIAGDEGIKAQTVEAIDKAKEAKLPILVAINKCDKPNYDVENVYRQLADKDLLPEAWGGQVITVNCSAVTKEGIKEMLEMLALQAEILELKANPKSRARGTVLESEMHKGLGPIATVLVQNGTLHIGNAIVFAQHYARVKTMHNEYNQEITTAGPSAPIKITGLSGLPAAGSEFIVVKNEREAIEIAQKRSEGQRHHAMMQQPKRISLENFLDKSIQKKTLNLILRADVQGSVEALKSSLLKIHSKRIELNIISASVGEISESDIQLAQNTKATIIGFHTQVENHAESLIKTLKVTVKLYDIIYHAVNETRDLMRSMLDKIPQENDVGAVEVKAVFKSSHLGIIAGCTVTEGNIKRSTPIRLLRSGEVIWKGTIQSLKKVKEDVREVSKGYECGIVLSNNNDIKVGDLLQAYEITYLDQEL